MTDLHLNGSSNPPPFPPSLIKAAGQAKKSSKPLVLVIDDERLIADTVVAILNQSGFVAEAAYNGADAIELAREKCPQIVLSDVMMPHLDGIEASIAIRKLCPDSRVVLFSGHATTTELLASARKRGHDFELLAKPLHPKKLIEYLQQRA